MLTRLKISGFKNLVDVDIRFGPFTCIAGANGTGKSNLFDAIHFLSALADNTLMEAALSVRSDDERTGDIRSLFHRVGEHYDETMEFEAEMIVPQSGIDDLGQQAEASTTFLRYRLVLAYQQGSQTNGVRSPRLEIRREELTHITQGDAPTHLLFDHSIKWRSSVIKGARRSPLISTDDSNGAVVIRRHQDGNQGRPLDRLASSLPRTVLSSASASESPTALMARLEIRSWKLLQLEPNALRRPDRFIAPPHLRSDGGHLAATLNRLAQSADDPERVYATLANRVAELIDDVRYIWIDKDDSRETYTLYASAADRTPHKASALSDGTLRFLALAVIAEDPEANGVLCLEEPENGIHPARIPAIIQLLIDIAVDPKMPVDETNPLRQVIVNTHSPSVVAQVPDDSLVVVSLYNTNWDGFQFKRAVFHALSHTWRTTPPADMRVVSKGDLLSYLNPIQQPHHIDSRDYPSVREREDLQILLPGFEGN